MIMMMMEEDVFVASDTEEDILGDEWHQDFAQSYRALSLLLETDCGVAVQ